MSPKKASHENPLIPNARLRQIYRAILRAHLLGQALPPAQRVLTATREAALVSTSIGLTPRDLVLDAVSGPVIDFLRGVYLHRIHITGKQAPHPGSAWVGAKSSKHIHVNAGSCSRLPATSDPAARIHAALGAAAALKTAATLAKKSAEESEVSAQDSAVALAYAISGEISADLWKPALDYAAQHDLPVIFVVLPHAPSQKSRPRAAQTANLRAIAHRAGAPAIPVDAADPVALYRVAQESIGHARIGGGPALIECVSFPEPRTAGLPAALQGLQRYILHRNIATRAWMDREAASFSTQIRSLKSASK